MTTVFNTKTTFLGRLPTSLQGQFLIETPDMHGQIHRQVVNDDIELRRHVQAESTVWMGRFGGWIKQDNKFVRPEHRHHERCRST